MVGKAPRFLFASIAGSFALGCGGGPTVVPVAGVATANGKPVSGILVNFEPENGRSSWGITDNNGRFTLEYDASTKGAMVGNHSVSAKFWPRTPEEEMAGAKAVSPEVREIQKKYGNQATTPMKVEIKAATKDLELKFD